MLRAYSDECRTDDTEYSAVESMSELSLSVAEEQHAPACGAIPSKGSILMPSLLCYEAMSLKRSRYHQPLTSLTSRL